MEMPASTIATPGGDINNRNHPKHQRKQIDLQRNTVVATQYMHLELVQLMVKHVINAGERDILPTFAELRQRGGKFAMCRTVSL